MKLDLDEQVEELIDRLTPKTKEYSISIERISTDYFDYVIEAASEDEAIMKAKELAEDESDFWSEVELNIDSVNCHDDSEEEIERVDPFQMSFGGMS